jgi:2-polyprenyl-6-methoxyphenol hydroxylase-like FAD-dependent oxidoreductase
MASVIVCGGSVVGLSTAMLLAADGHHVTVLERDPAPPPPDPPAAWEAWSRRGVAQFHQPHVLFPRFSQILDDELPGVVDRLVDAGCARLNPLEVLPPTITDTAPRPDDRRFHFVTGRRPVVEAVIARAAEGAEGVEVLRGVAAAEVLSGDRVVAGAPHVTGVRTTAGDALHADLVVDAGGRRSALAEWLRAAGGRAPRVESEGERFVYHTRYFRGPERPETIGPPVSEIGTISLLTLAGDNDTWSVTVWGSASDTALRGLRDPDRFAKVVGACPLHAHWVDGEPITEVLTMAGVLDRYRRFVVDDEPVATGVAAVGDAWACTNPSAGRGMTVGLMHAQCLRNTVRSHLGDGERFARAWDATTEAEVAPFYWSQITTDRERIAEMNALRRGVEPPPPDPERAAVFAAAAHDPDVLRGVLEMTTCLALPDEVVARPGFMDKVRAVRAAVARPIPGPHRAALLELLA